jgi:hypothetical protein
MEPGVLGAPETVSVLCAVASEHPPVPETVYVITDVPEDTPVIRPLPLLIVATPVVALDHAPPASPSDE